MSEVSGNPLSSGRHVVVIHVQHPIGSTDRTDDEFIVVHLPKEVLLHLLTCPNGLRWDELQKIFLEWLRQTDDLCDYGVTWSRDWYTEIKIKAELYSQEVYGDDDIIVECGLHRLWEMPSTT